MHMLFKDARIMAAAAAVLALGACQDAEPTGVRPDAAPVQAALVESLPASGPFLTGYVLGPSGRPMRIAYRLHNGHAIWEGDIDLGPAERIASTREELLRPAGPRGAVMVNLNGTRWPGGVVPYVIDGGLPSQSRVTSAIAHIESTTGIIDFVPRTTESDYVVVQSTSSGCGVDAVGRKGGVQYMYLETGCTTGNVIHEFVHVLGAFHEQSRCDRDSYVEILWQNMQTNAKPQFYVECDGATDFFGYDEGSIMHYSTHAFSSNGGQTIRSRRGLDGAMGQRNGLSTVDRQTLDHVYPSGTGALTVEVEGPNALGYCQTAEWIARPAGGNGAYTYVWQLNDGFGNWSTVGTAQSYSQYICSAIQLRVITTSASQSVTTLYDAWID